jgi:serine phosphatase RsbU (regulator of sigma subunit)
MEKIQFTSDPLDAQAVWRIPPGWKVEIRWRYLVLMFFLLVPMSLTAILGTINFTGEGGTGIASFWPAAALQVVFSIWFGIYGAIVGILGPMVGNGLIGNSCFLFIPGNTVQSCLVGLWFRYRLLDPRLRRRKDWVELILVGILLSNGLGAVLGLCESQLRGIPELYLNLKVNPDNLHQLGFLADAFYHRISHNPALIFWVDKFPNWFLGNILPCLFLVPAMLKAASGMIVRDPFFCQSFWGGAEPANRHITRRHFNDQPIIAKLMLLTLVAGIFPLSFVGVWSVWDDLKWDNDLAVQSNLALVRDIRTRVERHDLAIRVLVGELDQPGVTDVRRQKLIKEWDDQPGLFSSLKIEDRAEVEKQLSAGDREYFKKHSALIFNQTPAFPLEGKPPTLFAVARLKTLPDKVLFGEVIWREESSLASRLAKREALLILDANGKELRRNTPPALGGWHPNIQPNYDKPYLVTRGGQTWDAAEAYLPHLEWRFITLTSSKKAQAFVREKIPNSVALVINLAIFGSLIAGSLLARRISDRVLAIAEYVQEKGAEPGQLQIPIQGRDELGYLSQTLNQMSCDLGRNVQRLKETMAEKERLAAEMELARQVQLEILPKGSPKIPGYEIAAVCQPAREVGGDFYDFISTPSGLWVLIIGDVAGKGLKAAMYVTETHGLIHAVALAETRPEQILEKVNAAIISARGDSSDFVTLFCGVLDPGQNRLFYSIAGHNPPFLRRGSQTQSLEIGGLPLAVMPNTVFPAHQVDLEPGDTLVMYTDGITEAMNAEKKLFQTERLETLLRQQTDQSLDQLHQTILQSILQFAGDTPQSDDITLLSLRRVLGPHGMK